MHTTFKLSAIVALLISGMTAGWSTSSLACSDSPILGSICIMATPANYGSFNHQYVPAAGQQLSITQNTALYSLIGTAYGGDARTTFNLPDLRGRVIVGTNGNTYQAGIKGGQETVNLTIAQLPPHNFQIISQPVDLSKVTATTTLTGLTGTANLAGVTISGTASGLTIKASSANSNQAGPGNNYLAKPIASSSSPYTSNTPDVTLNSGSISGNLSLTAAAGTTAPVTMGGTPATTIGGTATVSGQTNIVGTGAAVSVMQPYLALTYYIATSNALYPSRD